MVTMTCLPACGHVCTWLCPSGRSSRLVMTENGDGLINCLDESSSKKYAKTTGKCGRQSINEYIRRTIKITPKLDFRSQLFETTENAWPTSEMWLRCTHFTTTSAYEDLILPLFLLSTFLYNIALSCLTSVVCSPMKQLVVILVKQIAIHIHGVHQNGKMEKEQ